MNKERQNTDSHEEIDLAQIFGKVNSFFDNLSTKIFNGILFFKKNLLIVSLLVIIGSVSGYFIEKAFESYKSEIIVRPNFGSFDFLYNKVNLINSKIKQKDTVFIKSLGVKNPKSIVKITIAPIVDIYGLVNDVSRPVNNAQNSQNFELLKLLSDEGDINKVIKDSITSKNYGSHRIVIITSKKISDQSTVDPILNYLNNSEFYSRIQKTYISNIQKRIKSDEVVITQIDALINQFISSSSPKGNQLVFYNENTQLNDIINNKNGLVDVIGANKVMMQSLDKVIKDTSRTLNIKKEKGILKSMMVLLPLLLVFAFVALNYFKSFYNKQLLKSQLK